MKCVGWGGRLAPQGRRVLGTLVGGALPLHTLYSPKSPHRRKVLSTNEDDQ